MENQKHAVVIGQQQDFQVLQTAEGDAVFFSIGTDHGFYVTTEVRKSHSGWSQVDLSSTLGKDNAKAKAFAVSQNPKTMAIDLALISTEGDGDSLYISRNNSASEATWKTGITWTKVPFDAASGSRSPPVRIADVYLLTQPLGNGPGALTWFVDIVRSPGNGFQLLERYYVEPDSAVKWVKHTLPNDVEEGSISSCLGRRQGDCVDGIYTFGRIGGSQSLIFTPKKNIWAPRSPPQSSRLQFPAGSTAISSTMNDSGVSSLFVAAEGGLYYFKPDQQKDGAAASLIIPSSPVCGTNTFSGSTRLFSSTVGSRTAVWGLNGRLDLVCSTCPAGHETDPAQWSPPVRICPGVSRFAFYRNIRATGNVLFALLGEGNLTQLTQDPASGTWLQRQITLPALDSSKVFESSTFTTHVKLMDGNGMPGADHPVAIRSKQAASLTINNIYRKIDPNSSVEARTDGTGGITIIQEVQSLPAAPLQITYQDNTVDVDPQSKVVERLSEIQSGKDLDKIQIKTKKGDTKPLVPSDVSQKDKDAVARCIPKLLEVRSGLPKDGSIQTKSEHITAFTTSSSSAVVWGVVGQADDLQFIEGDDAAKHLGGLVKPIGVNVYSTDLRVATATDSIAVSAGDMLRFLKDAWDVVGDFLFRTYEGITQFVVSIGNKIYTAIIDSVNAVIEAIEFVFAKIKVFFEDLIRWLGFLFSWNDILLTHRVIKNIMRQYAKQAVGQINVIQQHIQGGFRDIRGFIDPKVLDHVQDSGKPIGEQQNEKVSTVPGTDSPQNNWAVYHANNGIGSASGGSLPGYDREGLEKLLVPLENAIKDQGKILQDAFQKIKDRIVSDIHSLTPIQVIQEIFKIVGVLVIDTAENIVMKLLDLVKIFVSGLFSLLDDPIEIPVISPLYKWITNGDALSCLDLICLVAAIPGTIIYKLVTGSTPFLDNEHTKRLIDAPDFKSLSGVLSGSDTGLISLGAGMVKTTAALHPAKVVTAVLKCSTLFISHINVGLSYAKREAMASGKIVGGISVALWLAAASPTIASNFPAPGKWTIVSDSVLAVGLFKVLADNAGLDNPVWKNAVSPSLAAIMALIGLVPSIGGYVEKGDHQTSDEVALVGSICSASSGVLTFFTPLKVWGPEISAPAFAISMGLALLSGGFSAASGCAVLMEAGKQST